MQGDKEQLKLTKEGVSIIFNEKIRTAKGFLFVMRFVRVADRESALTKTDFKEKINIKKAHSLLAHLNEEDTRKTITYSGTN